MLFVSKESSPAAYYIVTVPFEACLYLLLVIQIMGIISFTEEFPCRVSPTRMFKALVVDYHILLPKLMPQGIKSVEFTKGDGGAGSIKQINFAEGSHFKYMKHRIDAMDHEKCVCKYTLIEGDVLGEKVESIAYEVKFETSSGENNAVCKMTSEYHTVGDFEINEDEIKAGKAAAMALYNVVETYLVENPQAYA